MSSILRTIGVLFFAGVVATSCASSGSSSNNSKKSELAEKSSKNTKKSKSVEKKTTKKTKVAVKEIKTVRTGLTQRPSEINIPVRGRVTRTGEVYLLRGLANVFSRGMDTLGAKMVRTGLDARVYNHGAWRDLADNIVARAKRKEVSYPIIIMGHSLGANASMLMAQHLGNRGVKVSYVVSFDPTTTGRVGKNVGRVINYYLPNNEHSNVVKRVAGKGVVKNINVRGIRGLKHTTVEKDAKFHTEVINRTVSYTKKRRKKRRS